MLEQALNITEAGVLVYDVCDPKSLQLIMGIAEFVRDYLDKVNGISSPLTSSDLLPIMKEKTDPKFYKPNTTNSEPRPTEEEVQQ